MSLPVDITVVGRLVADPELRFTPQGTAVANFTVAANSRTKSPSGEWKDGPATFLPVTVWRTLAEHVADSLNKGDLVIVVGDLSQRSYEARDGSKRTAYEVSGREVGVSLQFATARPQKPPRASAIQPRTQAQVQAQAPEDPWAVQSDGAPF